MNNKDLKAWLEKERGFLVTDRELSDFDKGMVKEIDMVLRRLESDPEPGGMDPEMRAELERTWLDYSRGNSPGTETDRGKALFARHLLDTYGGRVCEWRPIDTAPHDKYILIRDGDMLADFVFWKDARPARSKNGAQFLPVPEGWFTRADGRSPVTAPTHWFPIPPFCGGRIQEVE